MANDLKCYINEVSGNATLKGTLSYEDAVNKINNALPEIGEELEKITKEYMDSIIGYWYERPRKYGKRSEQLYDAATVKYGNGDLFFSMTAEMDPEKISPRPKVQGLGEYISYDNDSGTTVSTRVLKALEEGKVRIGRGGNGGYLKYDTIGQMTRWFAGTRGGGQTSGGYVSGKFINNFRRSLASRGIPIH